MTPSAVRAPRSCNNVQMRCLTNTPRTFLGLYLSPGVAAAALCAALLLSLTSCGSSDGSGAGDGGGGSGSGGNGGGGTGGGGITSQGAWSWEGGSNGLNATGVYGAKGVPAPGNVPGASCRAHVTGAPRRQDFWLFGGSNGEASATTGSLNDLWRYSAATGQWTWMSGSSEPGAPGAYGSRGVARRQAMCRALATSQWHGLMGQVQFVVVRWPWHRLDRQWRQFERPVEI